MKATTKKIIRIVLISIVSIAFLLFVADFIMAIYDFNLMMGEPDVSEASGGTTTTTAFSISQEEYDPASQSTVRTVTTNGK